MENLLLLALPHPLLLYFFCFIFGAIMGSFVNVVVYRLPLMMFDEMNAAALETLEQPAATPARERFNIAFPASHCPECKQGIRALENIPILSYLLLGGKCSACKHRISPVYPLVELLAGSLSVLVIYVVGPNLAGILICLLSFALLALAVIDYAHKLLPDKITLPLVWAGLIGNYFEIVTDFSAAFWGAVSGYMSLWMVFHIFKLVTGKTGMGFGDFKLLALLGAWMGWQLLPLTMALASMAAVLVGGGFILLGRRDKNQPIAFGPYLAGAGLVALLWGKEIL